MIHAAATWRAGTGRYRFDRGSNLARRKPIGRSGSSGPHLGGERRLSAAVGADGGGGESSGGPRRRGSGPRRAEIDGGPPGVLGFLSSSLLWSQRLTPSSAPAEQRRGIAGV